MLNLYTNTGYTSPYGLSVYVALKEKSLPFEVRLIDLEAGEHRRPDYAARSGTVRIPLLEHDDFRLTESTAICEYLEESFPSPGHARIYPSNVQQRARARQIQSWVRSDLVPLRAERPIERVFIGERLPPLSDKARAAADKLIAFASELIGESEQHLFGAWSIADSDLGVILNRLVLHGDEVPDKLAAYARRQWQRPSLAEWGRLAGWVAE